MKPTFLLLTILAGLAPVPGSADPEPRHWMNGRELHGSGIAREVTSCFQGLREGQFTGSVSGLLALEVPAAVTATGKEAIVNRLLPIDHTKARLKIVPDEYEIYDVSTKRYRVSHAGVRLTYSTYAGANALSLEIEGVTYESSTIDGACDEGIDFLNFDFLRDEKNEYLVLVVTEPLRLRGVKDADRVALLKPGSVLMFKYERPAASK